MQYFLQHIWSDPILLQRILKQILSRDAFQSVKQSDLAAAVNPTEPVMTTPFVVAAAMNDQKVSVCILAADNADVYVCRVKYELVRLHVTP